MPQSSPRSSSAGSSSAPSYWGYWEDEDQLTIPWEEFYFAPQPAIMPSRNRIIAPITVDIPATSHAWTYINGDAGAEPVEARIDHFRLADLRRSDCVSVSETSLFRKLLIGDIIMSLQAGPSHASYPTRFYFDPDSYTNWEFVIIGGDLPPRWAHLFTKYQRETISADGAKSLIRDIEVFKGVGAHQLSF